MLEVKKTVYSEGNFDYYGVYEDGKKIGEVSVHRVGGWIGRVPASDINPEGIYSDGQWKEILLALSEKLGRVLCVGPENNEDLEVFIGKLLEAGIEVKDGFIKKEDIARAIPVIKKSLV